MSFLFKPKIVNKSLKDTDLRKYLLGAKLYEIEEVLVSFNNSSSDPEEIYKFLCEFYTECDVKGVVLHEDVRKFIIDYVVKYRLEYASKKDENTTNDDQLLYNDISGRVQLLKNLLNENNEFRNLNPIEIIIYLKTVVRVMRPLIFDKKALKLPWDKIQFVVCIFIATKTDQTRLPNWLKDNYYQLIVTEEFVGKLLRLLLSRLEDVEQKAVDWSELDDIYNIAKMYYLVLKMYWNVQILFEEYFGIKDKYRLQVVGECLFQLNKLNYEEFEDFIHVSQKMDLYSTVLVQERHKLAHFHQISYDKVNIHKLYLFILELIQIVRSKIEERLLKEFRTYLSDSIEKLLRLVNQISFKTFSRRKTLELIRNINFTLSDLKRRKYSNVVFDIGNKLKNILLLPIYENETFLNFVNNLKRKSKDGTNNRKLSKEIITDQLNQISPQPFKNIRTLLDLYLSLLPDSIEKRFIEDWTTNLCTDYVMKNQKNADDETFIQNILIKIENSIEDDIDKRKFAKKVSKLMKERCEFYENKFFKHSNSRRLRNNEIKGIIVNKNKNLSDFDIAENFLKQIKWENVDSVIEKMRREEQHHTIDSNNDFNQMNLLDLFELAKKRKVKFLLDFNYLDYDCPIPVGRNLRNHLAHGDICIDISCPDIEIVKDKHGYYFHYFYQNQEQSLGFSRPDDFDLVWNNFRKQMCWAREAWDLLNWNNDRKVLEKYELDPMAFMVRDPAGLSIIHYSLKEINENNIFLKFLISKLSSNTHSKENSLLEKLMSNYVPSRFNTFSDRNLLDYNSISFYINDLYQQDLGLTLARILCFNCPNIEILNSVRSKLLSSYSCDNLLHNDYINYEFHSHCGLLQIAVAQNQTEIVKFLLKQGHYKHLINSKYNGFTALEYAIMNGNVEMVSILLQNGVDINHKSGYFCGEGLPLSMALVFGDPVMLSILKSKGMEIDIKFVFDIQSKIKINSNPEMWTCILNFFCETEEDFEMLLHIACLNEKFNIVKTIIEDKPLDSNSVKEKILMSCYNLKSPDILEYLINKGAVLKLVDLKLICAFASIEVIEFLITNDYLKGISEERLIGRNKEIIGALLNANCEIDLKAVDNLPLQFILDQNLPRDFIAKRIITSLMQSSTKKKYDLIENLKDRAIRIPLSVFEYITTELGLDKSNWLRECEFEETTQDWNEVLKTAVKCDHYLLARLALKRGADINISVDNRTLMDFYIDKNQGKVSEMMKLLSEFKCPSHYKFDFNNFTIQDQLLFGYLTKNEDMIRNTEGKADLGFKYSNFRDGTILHILYHYGIKLSTKEEESSIKNIDNCTPFDLLVLNNPFRPLPSHFSEISPFQRLIAGILRSNFEVMENALENGADINSVLDHLNYFSPLHVAIRENLTNVVEFLLSRGSSPHQIHSYQQLPLETSVLNFDNDSIVELLLQHMSALANDDFDYMLKLAHREGRKKVLKALIQRTQYNLKTRADYEAALKRGLDINLVPNEYLETYLHIACYNRDLELIEFLLEEGADPLVKNCFNELPIHIAIANDNFSAVDLFLAHNFAAYNSDDLLGLSLDNNSLNTAITILETGDINDDPFEFPCRMPNNTGHELVKTLFTYDNYYEKYTKIFDVAVTNFNYILATSILSNIYQLSNTNLQDVGDFEEALKRGINLDSGPELDILWCEIPYLHYATFCCESNVVEFLLKKGANPFITDFFDRLPIEYAIRLDDVEKVKLLYDKNSRYFCRKQSYNLRTLLLLAFKSNSLESVQFLIQNGLKRIQKKTEIIDEILEKACGLQLNKGLEIVKYILKINLKLLDLKKWLNLSKENNNFEIASLLISLINKHNRNETPLSLSLPCSSSDTPTSPPSTPFFYSLSTPFFLRFLLLIFLRFLFLFFLRLFGVVSFHRLINNPLLEPEWFRWELGILIGLSFKSNTGHCLFFYFRKSIVNSILSFLSGILN